VKVAVYIRVSRSDLNLDNQRLALEDYVKQRSWEYQVFEEQESTRKTRPIKEEVLQLIRNGKFDGVIVYKLDRWARSLQELISNIDEITNRGKFFISITQPIDTSGSAGRLMLQILGAFAEFEREMIRERTLAGLDRARAQGKVLGRPKKKGVIKQGGFTYTLKKD
jgi:DNA invertase Pin-like site-specific DNA recombinase